MFSLTLSFSYLFLLGLRYHKYELDVILDRVMSWAITPVILL